MRGKKTKIISLILVAVMILGILSLTSCNRSYDKAEVEEAAKNLLKDVDLLNKVYFGSGIRYHEADIGKGVYRRAESSHLEELGFSTIEELKIMTERVFSDDYCQDIYSSKFSGLKDGITVIELARYYEAVDEETQETYIVVNSDPGLIIFKDTVEYDYDSVRAEKAKKEKVYVSVDVTVTNSEGKSQKRTITITMVEDEDGWKIDGPTFANYDELLDVYDKLKDQDFD